MTQAIAISPPESAPIADWHAMRDQATTLVKSGFLPRAVDTPEKAIAIMQTGREIGIGPMQALRAIHIIDGKPVMAAELIAGLVLARIPGAKLRVAKTTETECIVHAARPGDEPTEYRWTMQDAQRAGLTNKQNWKNYPRAMLRNRAIAEAARGTFPDATMGLYDPDELGAITTPTGEIVTTPPRGTSVAAMVAEEEPYDPEQESTFPRLRAQLDKLEELTAKCTTYEEALTIRAELGSKAKPAEALLTREMQEAIGKGQGPRTITQAEAGELGRTWQRIDRQLTKREKELATSIEASFISDERQPGDDG